MARLSALGVALLLHSVIGISYYYFFKMGRCSSQPSPILGNWLFTVSVVSVLQAVRLIPSEVPDFTALVLETIMCCFVLDLMLTKLWCRIESLVHCAIVGVLQICPVGDDTFMTYEYWTQAILTTVIGACLLWVTAWAMALPRRLQHGLQCWRRSCHRQLSRMLFSSMETRPPLRQESSLSFAA
ncbi:uncharacterized protein [Drosophila pseudoobscura]|uniref:Uncharacterized protein n=1 Tax=Drosophila pseudoobscura pseudoobscura TaxID=46245 RepID=Q29IX6_DROPS|nr:uncharacterized protein LOC4815578 [Drosophila pseudoobscura]